MSIRKFIGVAPVGTLVASLGLGAAAVSTHENPNLPVRLTLLAFAVFGLLAGLAGYKILKRLWMHVAFMASIFPGLLALLATAEPNPSGASFLFLVSLGGATGAYGFSLAESAWTRRGQEER